MDDNMLYPKDIETLINKINFYIENVPEGFELENYKCMLNWINKISDKFNYTCKDDEYIRVYKKGKKYALQVWKKEDTISVVAFNLIANFVNEYSNDDTILVDDVI